MIFWLPFFTLILMLIFSNQQFSQLIRFCLSVYLFFMGAFKVDVGADFENYRNIFELSEISWFATDLGFVILSKVSYFLELGYRGVHVQVAAICTASTWIFRKRMRLSLTGEITMYLVFIVMISFGFLRQAMSVSFIMLGEAYRPKSIKFLFFVGALASHGFCFLYYVIKPILQFKINNNMLVNNMSKIVMICALLPLSFYFFASSPYLSLESNGVYIRLAIILLPLVLLTTFSGLSGRIQNGFILILLLIILSLKYSTIVDRLVIYFIPLIVIYINEVEKKYKFKSKANFDKSIAVGQLMFFTVWLFFAPYAKVFWQNFKFGMNA